jgi:hypothetical protein
MTRTSRPSGRSRAEIRSEELGRGGNAANFRREAAAPPPRNPYDCNGYHNTPRNERKSHWYSLDGKPCHTVPTKDGGDKRNTTLRDARKLNLLPSVTNIIGILDKPQLTKWKMREVAKAAIAIPGPQGEEPVERFADRAIEAAMSQVSDAADLGTKIHDAIENLMRGSAEQPSEEMRPYVKPVLDWMRQVGVKVTHSEIVLVNAVHGFAGRVDALFTWGDGMGKMGILDFKTKKTKEGEKVEAYDEHVLQLAAYAATHYGATHLQHVVAANLFISSTEPGRLEVVKHDKAKLVAAYEAFSRCVRCGGFARGMTRGRMLR